jgi:hypothetical protein
MMEGSGAGAGVGSVPRSKNGSGSASGRPQNIRILRVRIRNTVFLHLTILHPFLPGGFLYPISRGGFFPSVLHLSTWRILHLILPGGFFGSRLCLVLLILLLSCCQHPNLCRPTYPELKLCIMGMCYIHDPGLGQ